jgi:hypothetical protein
VTVVLKPVATFFYTISMALCVWHSGHAGTGREALFIYDLYAAIPLGPNIFHSLES